MKRIRQRHAGALLAGLIFLGGCSSWREPALIPNAPASDKSIQEALDAAADTKRGYLLTAGDVINVSVYREPDLTTEAQVGQSGLIDFPMVGKVKVARQSVQALEDALTKRYGRYLVDPHVQVTVKKYHSIQISVLGEVMKPGIFDLPVDRKFSALEAVIQAGGFTASAAPARTRVIRNSEPGSVQTINVPIPDIIAGDKSKDIKLEKDDVVYVPKKSF